MLITQLRGYRLANGIPGSVTGDCLSDVKGGATLTYASTAATATKEWHTKTTTLTRPSQVGAIAVVGWNVARAATSTQPTQTLSSAAPPSTYPLGSASSSDRDVVAASAVPSSTTSRLASSRAPQTSASSSLTQAAATTPTPSPSDGISTGVKVGIGLGVSLGVIGIAALVISMVMLRQRSRRSSADDRPPERFAGINPETKQMPLHHLSEETTQAIDPHELPNNNINQNHQQIAEFPGSHSPTELETNPQKHHSKIANGLRAG